MPRISKFEETYYEKTEFSGKIFMYSSVSWNVLFPVVDIIRLLKKNTIIGFKHGKGQQIIKNYSQQYNHRTMGYDLIKKSDYLDNLRMVKTIFIFTDESDTFATNLINFSKTNKINTVCYSNLDTTYYFYEKGTEKITFKKPEEVIEKMYYLNDLNDAKKIAELFPDFEIIEHEDNIKSTLEECMELLEKAKIEEKNNRININKIYFDPASSKLKKAEYERSQRNRKFDDEDKNKNNKTSTIRSFFKSKV